MPVINSCEVPEATLLRKYKDGAGYADCYVAEVDIPVVQATFIEAFYTTALFKTERAILKWCVGRPSTDRDARDLAAGTTETFAAWRVEDRTDTEILLADYTGRTRSWLRVAQAGGGEAQSRTLLYFGSAVIPRADRGRDTQRMSVVFYALLAFHRLYSRLLLNAARSRVLRRMKDDTSRAGNDA